MSSYFSSGKSHLILFKLLIEKWGVVRKTFVNWLNHLFKNSSFFEKDEQQDKIYHYE